MRLKFAWLVTLALAANASAAGRLIVEHAWIRSAPPGAAMLAGYAVLKNAGDASLIVTGASSADFGDVSLHESFSENGVERMRPLGDITIAPGSNVAFAPGGKHFMLMDGKHELHAGDTVKIHISTKSGGGADGEFAMRDTAP
ncbi:MAG: copper chaperone PCu(A)C [Proteobacteria bacterium]|nr:copper chaperone PCu(A)C [Pseudomonadota bacterium]